jgi:hypothetical protein
MKYKIVKGYVSTFNRKEKTVWNVVDENDGFIMDTFSLKRDAKLWIYCHALITGWTPKSGKWIRNQGAK